MRKRDIILFAVVVPVVGAILALPYALWRLICWLLYDPRGDD